MKLSKSLIDKSGKALARDSETDVDKYISYVETFDEYRKNHLEPLSKMTIDLQRWLSKFGKDYFIAQRLKRKPQILRKLKRFSVRLSQLQDIGGTRIIVEQNKDVDELVQFLKTHFSDNEELEIIRMTDYRGEGREDSGYRAYHVVIERDGYKMELQIRSKIQHYWAETIERTSIVYGHHLKELEGDTDVILYFKKLSDLFYEIEAGRKPSAALKNKVEELRNKAEQIIQNADKKNVFTSFVNEGITRDLERKEKSIGQDGLNNWIFVFDWNSGSFVCWELISNDPAGAIAQYVEFEDQYKSEDGFEVVLVGSSNVASVRQTHSHYFGLDCINGPILEDLNASIVGFSNVMDIDVGAREILRTLERRHFWGTKVISRDTLKNHFCQGIITFESSLDNLVEKGLVLQGSGISLNLKRKQDINKYVY